MSGCNVETAHLCASAEHSSYLTAAGAAAPELQDSSVQLVFHGRMPGQGVRVVMLAACIMTVLGMSDPAAVYALLAFPSTQHSFACLCCRR